MSDDLPDLNNFFPEAESLINELWAAPKTAALMFHPKEDIIGVLNVLQSEGTDIHQIKTTELFREFKRFGLKPKTEYPKWIKSFLYARY